MQESKRKKIMLLTGAVCAWGSVTVQFILFMDTRVTPVAETIIRFFSYFTILTNMLAAIAYTSLLSGFGNKWKLFFEKAGNLTAVTVYLLIVGIVYNAVLRWLWNPQGAQKLVDEMLHLINPLFILIYWFMFVKTGSLKWINCLSWLLYPLIYCIYILIRGSVSKFYPYPFMNVNELGYPDVLLNCVYITIAFFAVAILLVAIGKLTGSKK